MVISLFPSTQLWKGTISCCCKSNLQGDILHQVNNQSHKHDFSDHIKQSKTFQTKDLKEKNHFHIQTMMIIAKIQAYCLRAE